jgi:hypothetical protein
VSAPVALGSAREARTPAAPPRLARPLHDGTLAGRVWRLGIAVSAFVTCGVLALFVAVAATYEGRATRDAARAPVLAVDEVGALVQVAPAAVARFGWTTEAIDLDQVTVLWFEVLAPASEPPPGLATWPRPGEVFASPAVMRHAGGGPFVARYGEFAGSIAASALADPGERLVVVGVDPGRSPATVRWSAITGFGRPVPEGQATGYLGSALYTWAAKTFWAGLALFAVAPALVLAVVTARSGGERRDRLVAVLITVGATRRDVLRFLVRETWRPTLLGTLTCLPLVALAAAADWQVPLVGFWVSGADLRAAWPALLAALLVGWVASNALVLALNKPRSFARGTRPEPAPTTTSRRGVIVLVCVVALTSWLHVMVYPVSPGVATAVTVLGAAAAVAVLGPATGSVLAVHSAAMVRAAARQYGPALLVGGRELSCLPRPALRVSVAVAAAVVVGSQAYLLLAQSSEAERQASVAFALGGQQTRIAQVSAWGTWVDRLADDLPAGVMALRLSVEPTADHASGVGLIGRCEDLRVLLERCPTRPEPLAELVSGQPPGWAAALPLDTLVRPADTLGTGADDSSQLLLVSAGSEPIDADQAAAALARHAAPVPAAFAPGESQLVAASLDATKARWVWWGAAASSMILLFMASHALTAEVLRSRSRLRYLTLMVSDQRVMIRLGLSLVAVPLLTATAVGVSTAAGLAAGPAAVPEGLLDQPWSLLGLLAALGCGYALAAGAVAGIALSRADTP